MKIRPVGAELFNADGRTNGQKNRHDEANSRFSQFFRTHLKVVLYCENKKPTYTRAAPKVMPPIYFHGNYSRYKEHNNALIEQILSYKTLFFDVVTTIAYALSPAMNNSLHAALVHCMAK